MIDHNYLEDFPAPYNIHSHPLYSMQFADATPEQFKEFWEAAGFDYFPKPCRWIGRPTKCGLTVFASVDGRISFYGPPAPRVSFTTFGEAHSAIEELAATKIFGGWAE